MGLWGARAPRGLVVCELFHHHHIQTKGQPETAGRGPGQRTAPEVRRHFVVHVGRGGVPRFCERAEGEDGHLMRQGQLGLVMRPVHSERLEPPLVGKGEDPGKFHERLALDEDDMPGIDAVGHLDGLRRGQWVSGR